MAVSCNTTAPRRAVASWETFLEDLRLIWVSSLDFCFVLVFILKTCLGVFAYFMCMNIYLYVCDMGVSYIC